MYAWLSHQLQNQCLIRGDSSVYPDMFNLGLIFITQIVESKTVLFCINNMITSY